VASPVELSKLKFVVCPERGKFRLVKIKAKIKRGDEGEEPKKS
jgi:hypothetical protein